MTIGPESRPKLVPQARMRLDRRTGRTVLLYPERGLVLNDIGKSVLELCTGERDVEGIAGILAAQFASTTLDTVRGEVLGFLQQLADRGLLEEPPPP